MMRGIQKKHCDVAATPDNDRPTSSMGLAACSPLAGGSCSISFGS